MIFSSILTIFTSVQKNKLWRNCIEKKGEKQLVGKKSLWMYVLLMKPRNRRNGLAKICFNLCIHFKFRGFHDNSLSFTVLRRLNDECLNCNIKVNSPVATYDYMSTNLQFYSFLFLGHFHMNMYIYFCTFFTREGRKISIRQAKSTGQKWFNFHGLFHPILT